MEISRGLAEGVLVSLRLFRSAFAQAGVEGGADTPPCAHPRVLVYPNGSVVVDPLPSKVALAGLRLAEACATAPGPAREFLSRGVFQVLWQLPSDPASTPLGAARALGAVCQGLRHSEVMGCFLEPG
ncbi:unnamed protein product, partial [Discosporangium mesarthrocarpum]